jgi:hypothetical protein
VSHWPGRPKKKCEMQINKWSGNRPFRAYGQPPGLARARFSSSPGPLYTLRAAPGRSARPPSPDGRHSVFVEGRVLGSGTVWSPRRRFIMPDTSNRHDPKLGVELMRRYCDPRGDFAWDSADRVRVHRWHRRCGPTSAPSATHLGGRFDDIFVNSSALVCLTTADRAGEACRAV